MILGIYGSWKVNSPGMLNDGIASMIAKYGVPLKIYAGESTQMRELTNAWAKKHNIPFIGYKDRLSCTHLLAFTAIGGCRTQKTIMDYRKKGIIVHVYRIEDWPVYQAVTCLRVLNKRRKLPYHKDVLTFIICPMLYETRLDQ